jgi:hypothetical protein
MIELGQCEITGVFGPMASGKTFLIDQWLETQNRYVRFDATGESVDEPGVVHVWKNPRQLYDLLEQNPYYFRIAYHPGADIQTDFFWVLKCLWRLDTYKLLVCDEFHAVCSVNETPKFVENAMRYARHDRLAIIGASQRIADVHKLFTSGCRKVVIFFSQEERDLRAVRDRWGEEAEEMVANCRPLLYDDRTSSTRQVPQCVVIAKGSPPQIYDFKTNSYVGAGSERPEDSDQDDRDLSGESVDDQLPRGREGEDVLPEDGEPQ